jgi:sugar-specific transcriptional regulator TrmB
MRPGELSGQPRTMSTDQLERPREAAIEQLKAFGLSTYAARTFVALVGLESGTAQDVSEVEDVPRTRVYDAADELEQRGLVDVEESTPQRFRVVSRETAGKHLHREFTRRVNRLREALDSIETTTRATEQRGIWTVSEQKRITERVVTLIDEAETRVVFASAPNLLTADVLDALEAAQTRGVSVTVAEPSATRLAEEGLSDEAPAPPWHWSGPAAGRFLLVDGSRTVVSAWTPTNPGEGREETALWGRGPDNALVGVLRALFDGGTCSETS